MRVMSLVMAVAPRTGKIVKNGPCFWKKRKIATKWYITLNCI